MSKVTDIKTAHVLLSIWRTTGHLMYTPRLGNEGILIPTFKKGKFTSPICDRSLCLLSATRNVAVPSVPYSKTFMSLSYPPHLMPVGFQAGLGTDMALLETEDTIQEVNTWIAVWDMNAASNRNTQGKLTAIICKHRRSHLTAAMITHLLQPLHISTTGDEYKKVGITCCDVPKRGPANRSLVNVYIDPLAHGLSNSPGCLNQHGGIFYAHGATSTSYGSSCLLRK